MKHLIFSATLLVTLITSELSFAQNKKQVSITLKNNSFLPRKYTLVSYEPSQKGNSTVGIILAPYGSKTIKNEVGTKLFLAEQKEINIVMSGKAIASEPFLIFKEELDNQTINLRKN